MISKPFWQNKFKHVSTNSADKETEQSMQHVSLATVSFLFFVLLAFPTQAKDKQASAQMESPVATVAAEATLSSAQSPKAASFKIPHNDIYLFTPGMTRALARYRLGEPFEPLAEFEKELKASPHLPSTHFWVGSRKLLFAWMDAPDTRYHKDVERHFDDCLLRAERAKKLPRLHHAGMFYESACNMGLSALYGLKNEFLDAGIHANRAIKGFFALHKERPEHHGTLMVVGSYNYYTSRFGTLGRLLLNLMQLPTGNRETGLAQLYAASSNDGPLDMGGKMMLVPALMNFENKPQEAVELAEETVRLVPTNTATHTLLATQYLMVGRLEDARRSTRQAQNWQPSDAATSKVHEVKARKVYIDMLTAIMNVLLDHDPDGLAWLAKTGRGIDEHPEGFASLARLYLAHIYRLADRKDDAERLYRWVIDGENGSRWLKDMGPILHRRTGHQSANPLTQPPKKSPAHVDRVDSFSGYRGLGRRYGIRLACRELDPKLPP